MTQESRQDPTYPRPPRSAPARPHHAKSATGGERPQGEQRSRPGATPPPKRTPRAPSHPRATPPPPEPRAITLNGVAVPYTVRVSARARRMRFVIRPTSGLEVVTPRGISQARIEEGLRAKAQWILATGARMAQQTQPTPTPLTTGRILPYLGQRLLLIVRTGAPAGRFRATMTALAAPTQASPAAPAPTPLGARRTDPPRIRQASARSPEAAHGLTQGRLDLASHAEATTQSARQGTPAEPDAAHAEADGALTLTVASADEPTVRAALEAWYRRQAQAIVAERLALWNQQYGFIYHRVTIKEQKTRWGSCSRQGNLNFNWRLLLAPLDILDYVLIHELSHLKEQNHAPRFWAVVAVACPEYRARRHWLRQHGHELQF